jgi:hypothetical protein
MGGRRNGGGALLHFLVPGFKAAREIGRGTTQSLPVLNSGEEVREPAAVLFR